MYISSNKSSDIRNGIFCLTGGGRIQRSHHNENKTKQSQLPQTQGKI